MKFYAKMCPKCGEEVFLYYQLSHTDRAEGWFEGQEFHVSEWKDTGDSELVADYWMCDAGHIVDMDVLGVEVVE